VATHREPQSPFSEPPGRFRDRLLLGFLRAVSFGFEQISIDRSLALGTSFGRLWYRLGGPRSGRVRDQLSQAFPEQDKSRREGWASDVFVHLGRGLVELVLLRGGHRKALLERVQIEGLDNLEAAQRSSPTGGALFLTAHCGNWELGCARVAATGLPISVVYRTIDQPVLDQALLGLRDASAVDQIPMGRAGTRVARALRNGRIVVVLLDQNAKAKEGVFVSFFGRPASTRYGPLTLAEILGVPILMGFASRDPDGRGHRMRIGPVLQLEAGSSDNEAVLQRNVQQITDVIENEIRASPGQWIWTHRRWRTKPALVDRR
jgi:KDO2-lipid IV(A) lauroyltransferase